MARGNKGAERPEWEESNRTLVMFTAIMLILVSFFILLVTQANYDETKHQEVMQSVNKSFGFMDGGNVAIGEDEGNPYEVIGPETGESAIQDLEMAKVRALLAPAIMDREARIIHSQGRRIVSLSAGLMFDPDSTRIKPEMEDTLMAFCRIMNETGIPVAVEGHTDNQPPRTEGVGDNWDISTGRAIAVLQFFVERGKMDIKRLTALGYAGTKPYYPNNSPANRARNNRVDLVLDFEKLSAEELRGLAEKMETWDFRGFQFSINDDKPAEER